MIANWLTNILSDGKKSFESKHPIKYSIPNITKAASPSKTGLVYEEFSIYE